LISETSAAAASVAEAELELYIDLRGRDRRGVLFCDDLAVASWESVSMRGGTRLY
jgi:hypothetical protein